MNGVEVRNNATIQNAMSGSLEQDDDDKNSDYDWVYKDTFDFYFISTKDNTSSIHIFYRGHGRTNK